MAQPASDMTRLREIVNMPDLTSLDNKLRLNLILNALSFRAGPSNVKAEALWMNYIRLVDGLIRGYNAARAILQEVVHQPENQFGLVFRASTQLETCLKSLRRAVRFARRLRLKRDCPACSELTVLSESVIQRINRIDQALEALENRILNRDVVSDDAVMPQLEAEGIRIEDEQISYMELAGWIQELNTLAIEMTGYDDDENAG